MRLKAGFAFPGLFKSLVIFFLFIVGPLHAAETADNSIQPAQRIAYLVSDMRIPFWSIMASGIRHQAQVSNFQLDVFSAENSLKRELMHTIEAIKSGVDGIIVSPVTSSSCVTILKLAKKAGIPVVIADIGTDAGEYLSYISSNNREGAYKIGKVLAERLQELGWDKGKVGIVAIPQKRKNGRARTAGFIQAMKEAGIRAGGLLQQVDFSEQETYRLSTKLIQQEPELRAIWLQGSNRYQSALHAIKDAGKEEDILLITFDAEPEFLQLIPDGVLVGSAMQQPFLMGEQAVAALRSHFNGESVKKQVELPILAVSSKNIQQKLQLIRRNVLGLGTE